MLGGEKIHIHECLIDTSGTEYEFRSWSRDVLVLDGWQEFLRRHDLLDFDDFIQRSGEVVDTNSRSVVRRLCLGDSGIFYLKIHFNYLRQGVRTGFKKIPVLLVDLENIMHLARAGLVRLAPVAWGLRKEGTKLYGFVLIEELKGYTSLDKCLKNYIENGSSPRVMRSMLGAVADMTALLHASGFSHNDLFSWHIFLRQHGPVFYAQVIDLERTEQKGRMPWSKWGFSLSCARDLASLHLTVPWPAISACDRLRFFLRYRGHSRLTPADRRFIHNIIKIARRMARRRKFFPYGVWRKLL